MRETMAIQKRKLNLPTKPLNLQKWILVGKAKLAAQIRAIRGIKQLEEGQAAVAAALSDTQDLAEELLYAEAQLGEVLEKIPDKKASSGGGTRSLPPTITKKQSHYAQELSRNEDAIARVVSKAREQGEVPVRQHVLKDIQANKPKPKTPPLPKGKFNIIYADPPWEYNDTKGNNPDYAGITYPTMKPEAIARMPIGDISADICILFIWVTMPMLDVCFNVIHSWGFEYKTCGFVWVKTKQNCLEADSRGIGHYTKSNAELCLIATKGQFQRKQKNVEQIIYSSRQKHSQKPVETRERIVDLCGDLPKIELFARKKTDGWTVYGNEL